MFDTIQTISGSEIDTMADEFIASIDRSNFKETSVSDEQFRRGVIYSLCGALSESYDVDGEFYKEAEGRLIDVTAEDSNLYVKSIAEVVYWFRATGSPFAEDWSRVDTSIDDFDQEVSGYLAEFERIAA